MRLRIGVVLFVVGLALALAGPVLAAIVWEWNAGDTCDWLDMLTDEAACVESGILIPANYTSYTSSYIMYTSYLPGSLVEPLSATYSGNCTSTVIRHDQSGYSNIEYSITTLPQTLTIHHEFTFLRIINPGNEDCIIHSLTLGEQDPEPTPTPDGSGGLISDFSPASLLSIAGELVTYLGSLIAIVGGVLLGFRLLGYLVRWLRGR